MRNFFTALFFVFCLTGLSAAGQAKAATLPKEVRDALARAGIPLSGIGIVVRQVDATNTLLAQNAGQAMNPASTMKLLTTFSALETLGPAYRWKTESYLDGKLENGVLYGNLVFKGYGDPKLTIEQFWLWLREIRQRGVRDIRGDIVLDRSFFEAVKYDPSEFDKDPTRAYNVGPNALLLNFNAMHLRLIPDTSKTGAYKTDALLEPDLGGYAISNHITVSDRQPCHGGDNYKERLEQRNIVLEGTIPVDCGEVDNYFSLLPHDEYFFAVFSSLWQELGGTLQGKLRDGIAPSDQAAFSTHFSPPLAEVIRDINKFSNNLMARQLFLTMGTVEPVAQTMPVVARESADEQSSDDTQNLDSAPPAARAGNIKRSVAAVHRWLDAQHLEFPELVLENGAGLSRKEQISPQHIADILQLAARSPFAAELEASLPILGMDGTLKKRLRDSDIAGYAHLKTGTLDGVKSMAGYVQAQSGKQWIVVFVVNHPSAASAQPAQDALVEWVQKGH